jgi:Flp pilus assembly protein TadG
MNIRNTLLLYGRPRGVQHGAALIEFSVILLVLLTIFYGIFVYSILFVTQQAVAYAAESGADAVTMVDPMTIACDPADPVINDVVGVRVNRILSFLPGGVSPPAVSLPPGPRLSSCQLLVTVSYPFSNWGLAVTGLFPMPGQIIGQGLVNTHLQ